MRFRGSFDRALSGSDRAGRAGIGWSEDNGTAEFGGGKEAAVLELHCIELCEDVVPAQDSIGSVLHDDPSVLARVFRAPVLAYWIRASPCETCYRQALLHCLPYRFARLSRGAAPDSGVVPCSRLRSHAAPIRRRVPCLSQATLPGLRCGSGLPPASTAHRCRGCTSPQGTHLGASAASVR